MDIEYEERSGYTGTDAHIVTAVAGLSKLSVSQYCCLSLKLHQVVRAQDLSCGTQKHLKLTRFVFSWVHS